MRKTIKMEKSSNGSGKNFFIARTLITIGFVTLIFSLSTQLAFTQQNTNINSSASAGSHGTVKSFTAYLKAPEVIQVNYSKEPPAITSEEQKRLEEGLNRTHLPGPSIQIKRTPVGPSQPQTVVKNLQAPQAAPSTFTLFKNVNFTKASYSTDIIDEPSTASKGRYVFYTGNWYAARSIDGGSTFSYVSPYANMGRGTFCCDQDVIYDPSRNLFIWYRQALQNSTGVNYFRLGVSNDSGNTWAFYSIYPTDINSDWTNQWWDYPQITLSNNYLYVTSNMFGLGKNNFTRAVILRYSLDELKAGTGFNYNYYAENRFTFAPVQGAKYTMYWGTHGFANVNFILFGWDEGSNVINWYSYAINPWNPIIRDTISSAYCPGPDGNDWCGRADSRVLSGYVANGIIGFFWMANPSYPATFPYTRGIRIRESDKSFYGSPEIWSTDYAWMYPAVSPNAAGNLGMSIFWGGGSYYPNHAVGINDDFTSGLWEFMTTAYGTNGPGVPRNQSWGDYLRARQYYGSGNVWSATGYTLEGGNTSDFIKPRYIIFGRERDAPNNPPENLTQFKSDSITAVPFRGTTDENTVVVKGNVYSVIDRDVFKLDVEIRPVGTGFSGIPNCASGPAVASGGTAVATCSNLNDSLYYHWQARANYSLRGAYSNWVSAGGNPEWDADFIITSINNCTTLTLPATYKLKRSIINSSAGRCIIIISSNATLDGRGYTVDGIDAPGTIGVYVSYSIAPVNVTVKNLNVTDWYYGIYYNYTANGTIIKNNVSSNNGYGIYLVSSLNNTVANNTANSSTFGGIYLDSSSNNSLNSNTVSSNSYDGVILYASNNNTLTNNIANSNGNGIHLSFSSNNTLTNNNVSSNGNGIVIDYSSYNNTLTSNNASLSNHHGFYISASNNTLTRNIANSNSWNGFYLEASSNNTLINNIASSNGNGIGIYVSSNNNISYNDVYNSTTTGIYFISALSYYNTMKGNKVNGDTYYHLLRENNILIENQNLNARHVSNLGKVSVIESKNVTLRNLKLTNNSAGGDGLFLYFSNSSNIINVTSYSNRYGIYLVSSSNNRISGSNASSSDFWGFYLTDSNNNTLTSNYGRSNRNGIYLASSSNNTITNNILTNGRMSENNGIALWLSYRNRLTSNIVSSNERGIYLTDSNNNTLTNNYASSNSASGILFANSSNNTITSNNANSNIWFEGISLTTSSNNNTLNNNTASSNGRNGIGMWFSSNNTLNNNNVSSNSNGVYLYYSSNNKIYNNRFSNTQNFYFDTSNNIWNITKTPGKNVVGGSYLGGNFWGNPSGTGFSQTCTDSNSDGICDSSYPLSSNNTDYLPLANKPVDKTPPASITGLRNVSYASRYINWTWNDSISPDFAKVIVYINGIFKIDVSKGKKYYNATGLLPNTSYTIGTRTVDTSGNINSTWVNHTARTKPDATPPRSITNLTNRTYALNYINWTWRDPPDADFSYVKVYIDGKFKTNVSKGKKFYNATGLLPNTTHRISTRTVDTSGNVNKTWVNHTARTNRDYTPPASITNLTNRTYARTYINWTWKDPLTYDFTKVTVYVNGIFKTNITKGKQYYNATGLKNNTYYRISTRTVDTSGNVNKTWVNHTVRTAP